jgi:hypothetical protein
LGLDGGWRVLGSCSTAEPVRCEENHMSEPATKHSFGTHMLVGACAGLAVPAGRRSGVGPDDVISHVDEHATAGPDSRDGATLTCKPVGRVSVTYLPDGTAPWIMRIPARRP